ncbi:MAG: D-2-hydroxyacid dehydrogenase [Alphaproteobacteria bacterium]|jgi:glyoxylate/hydroxypyruvate reductase A
MRVHIEWLTSKNPHMRIDADVWAEAAARHPALAATLNVSFGQNLSDRAPYADTEILIGQTFDKPNIGQMAPKLKWVYATSAGIEDLMPLDWLPPGVVLTNNSGTHFPKTREFVSMMLVMLHAKMPALITNQRERKWEKLFASLIGGLTVTVIGFGALGTATAEAARALGLKVNVVRRNPAPDPRADGMYGVADLHQALRGSDFLVIAAPLTPDTQNMIDAAALDCLNEGAGVINIGRGPLLDHDALCQRLDSGRLSGAILDVFDPEPLPTDSPLWDQENLVMTPHVLLDDPVNYVQRALDIFFQELARYRAGEPLQNRIDPKAGY